MYPKFSGVPSTIPLHARTSSTVVSNARCPHTSTPSIASSFAPATTASVIAAVPPEREWKTTSSCLAAMAPRSVLLDEGGKVEREVLAHVADEVDEDVTAVEAPVTVGAYECVAVTPAHDRLQRQRRSLLEDDERRSRRRAALVLVEVDDHVAIDVPGAR